MRSLRQILYIYTTILFILLLSAGLLFMPGSSERLWYGFAATLMCAAFAWGLQRSLRRKVIEPLDRFRGTLEDFSEGFVHEDIPESVFRGADPAVEACFRESAAVTRMMLRHVDNLEQGYEEERLAKTAQQQLTAAYERFVPKQFLRFLNKDTITQILHGDQIQLSMTVMISDIRGFTALSERITPEETFRILNHYFMAMEPTINRNEGFIDKYMGDAIMALFHRSPDDALRSAIDMHQLLQQENHSLGQIEIGIGINSGMVMLGVVGGQERMESTVISEAVNLAARFEDLNKIYGTKVLIGENTYESLKHPESFSIRMIDRVTVRGSSKPVTLYEVFDADEPEVKACKQRLLPVYQEAWSALELGSFKRAGELFEQCLLACPSDQASRIYVERCRKETRSLT